jgi:hypothetical protein
MGDVTVSDDSNGATIGLALLVSVIKHGGHAMEIEVLGLPTVFQAGKHLHTK